jgi:hypothetical protein
LKKKRGKGEEGKEKKGGKEKERKRKREKKKKGRNGEKRKGRKEKEMEAVFMNLRDIMQQHHEITQDSYKKCMENKK